VRPTLAFLAADFIGAQLTDAMHFAVAIELIHTYSLIHDDLPCMDDDDFRRGKPTSHKAFGEAIALLAGDALLNLAFQSLFKSVEANPNLLRGAIYLSDCAGGGGMIGGQAMEFSGESLSEEKLIDLYRKKTGALISASILCPCLDAGDNEKLSALKSFANAIGLAFQLTDDLLDEGKTDERSYLNAMGKDATLALLTRVSKTAEKSLANFPEAVDLQAYCAKILNRKA